MLVVEERAQWLARHFTGDVALAKHLQQMRDFTSPPVQANAGDSVKRLPDFCAGCPHNSRTRPAPSPKAGRSAALRGCRVDHQAAS